MKNYTLKQKLERIQEKKGWTQVQIGLNCDLKQGQISKIINGILIEERISLGTANKINALYNKIFRKNKT